MPFLDLATLSSAMVDQAPTGALLLPLMTSEPGILLVGVRGSAKVPTVATLDGVQPFQATEQASWRAGHRALLASNIKVDVDPATAYDPTLANAEPGDLFAGPAWSAIAVTGSDRRRITMMIFSGNVIQAEAIGYRSWRLCQTRPNGERDMLFIKPNTEQFEWQP